MSSTITLPRKWKLTTALCTTMLASSVCLFSTSGDSASLESVIQNDINKIVQNDINTVLSDIKNSKGGSKKDTDAADAFATKSPIKHVIVLIGENRGFDHTFGVYKPKGKGQTISNLLSKGIVNEDGTPGPNYKLAQQYSVAPQTAWYFGAPNNAKTPYNATNNLMPQPNTNGAPSAQSTTGAPFTNTTIASVEADIEPSDLALLTTGATGLPQGVLDTRIPGAGKLPPGPFVLQGPNISDDDYTGDMTHRFYQAAQQQDCSIVNATPANPSGCLNDLFPFVMATYASNNSQGNEMGFYNAEQEQASLLKALADRFAISDNFHQSVLGGTGANHFMAGTGDAGFWSDGQGNATTPPSNMIANPNPVSGTINTYTADNNFTACADVAQPGILPIVQYLSSLPYAAEPNCQPGHYYMVDNTNPGYLPNGTVVPAVQNAIPPSPVRTIGDALTAKNISWAYFGGSYNDAVIISNEAVAANAANPNLSAAAVADPAHAVGTAYCQICNWAQYSSSIMGDATQRAAHVQDVTDLIADIQNNTLPAVSYAKPDGLLDGHPSSSKIDLYEAFVQNILDALEANPHLKAETAVFVTWDEAGGYYDSGFVQPIDFFGDGPRIPIIALSPYSTGGTVNHNYADHVSLLKFIERNWNLQPLTDRSRDNLPNPKAKKTNLYVPTNSPAIDDLWDMFDFSASPNLQPYTE